MTLASGIELPTEAIAELCRRYYVRELSVFASAARGDMKPESDIDILVEFEPDAPTYGNSRAWKTSCAICWDERSTWFPKEA